MMIQRNQRFLEKHRNSLKKKVNNSNLKSWNFLIPRFQINIIKFIMEKSFNLSRYKELLKLEANGDITFLDLELLSIKSSLVTIPQLKIISKWAGLSD